MQQIKDKLKTLGMTQSTIKTYSSAIKGFITFIGNKIGDYDQVSKWVGHSVRQTTQIYTQCRKTDYSEAVEKCKTISIIT